MPSPGRTCLSCFDVKPVGSFASPLARKCDDCHAETERLEALRTRVCVRCGEARPLTDYAPHGRCCIGCKDKPRSSRSRRACMHCGVIKEADAFAWGDGTKGRGIYRRRKGVCLECEALERAAKERAALERRATWEQDGVLVRRCSQCADVLPLETGFYVTVPNSPGMKRWRYRCKACDIRRASDYKKRVWTVPELRAAYARRQRDWRKRNPEAYRAQRERYAQRVKADPQWHAERLEHNRMWYRLRQEGKGRSLDDIRKQRAHFPLVEGTFGCLPAMPLGDALRSYACREGMADERVCELAGIDPRNLFAWLHGERQMVQFDVADRVLTSLELSWWDVWDANDPAVRGVWEGGVAA
jgi:hypothetical protein